MKDYRILNASEVGKGILVEMDAGYVSPSDPKNSEILREQKELDYRNPFEFYAVLQKYGVPNRNGRVYPEKILKRESEKYKTAIKKGLSTSELNVSNFELHRGYQLVKINGCLSDNERDQLRFDVLGLDLNELSNLLDFPNQLSGRFSGWGVLSTPNNNVSILADANLEQFQIDGQMVGDVMLHSDWSDASKRILLEGTLQYRNERTFDFDSTVHGVEIRDAQVIEVAGA